MTSVLFVCTGNICRSPTAEGIFRHKLEERGLSDQFEVDSAGIIGYHIGEAPDPRTQHTAKKYGIDLSRQRARKVTEADFNTYDYILAMDQGHLESLQEMAPAQSSAILELMLNFHPNPPNLDVPDPYYGGSNGFELVYRMLDLAMDGFLEHLKV